ncbi:hypothetical protein SKAU_G00246850 [Synaphobranchus kaupii]|uniref:Uncharacterized protein n=1 Tax=Synaphobranchus kaupii TaxID=118154 RepID=A0A9Q1F2C5_SYNKA|nr:hypothetical protein SKAU_G00246850 [Synaphobranchus kaupii]
MKHYGLSDSAEAIDCGCRAQFGLAKSPFTNCTNQLLPTLELKGPAHTKHTMLDTEKSREKRSYNSEHKLGNTNWSRIILEQEDTKVEKS